MRTDLQTSKINTSGFPGLIKGNNSFYPHKVNIIKNGSALRLIPFRSWLCSLQEKKVTLIP